MRLFEQDPEYAWAATRRTPEQMATNMTNALVTGTANKDGKGIQRTCKVLDIPYTYAGIKAFFEADTHEKQDSASA